MPSPRLTARRRKFMFDGSVKTSSDLSLNDIQINKTDCSRRFIFYFILISLAQICYVNGYRKDVSSNIG